MPSDLNSKCRTCMCESNSYHQLIGYVEEKYEILEMLDCVVPQIEAKAKSQFSSLVCHTCVEKLLIAYKFQKTCIETNDRLLVLLETTVSETGPKLEKILDPLTTESNLKIEDDMYDVLFEPESRKGDFADVNKSTTNCLSDDSDSRTSGVSLRNGKYPCIECGKFLSSVSGLKQHKDKHAKKQDSEKPDLGSNVKVELTSQELGTNYESSRQEICEKESLKFNLSRAHTDNLENELFLKSGESKLEATDLINGGELENRTNKSKGEQKASLSALQQKASKSNHACTVCQRGFTKIRYLIDHITRNHPEIEKYKCDQCDKTFVLHTHLVKHLNRHKGKRNVVCPICEKKFALKKTLKEHMRTHSDEHPYLCTQCGKTFRSGSNLSQHMGRHTGLKKYQCPECPSSFTLRAYLAKHAVTHSNAKPHVCDICGSRYARTTALQKHKLLHSGERPYKCDQCSMTFAVSYNLRRHMRTHTGEKPYKCKYCDRAYAESGDLTKHLRTHIGENTYMCDQCPLAFKYQAELREHQSKHYKMTQKLLDVEKKFAEKSPEVSK